MRNSCHYVDGEMRPNKTEGFAGSTLAQPASIHPSLHLLTGSKEAFLSLKLMGNPGIMIFSQGGGKDPVVLHPPAPRLVLTSPKVESPIEDEGV